MRFERAGWLLAGLVAVAGFGPAMLAQNVKQEPDVLGALLVEVRGLRQAMEQMASAGPRVQLALGRLQLQEQRVNTMLRRLETVREQLGGAERALAQHQKQVADIEEHLKTKTPDANPERDAMVRFELKEMQRRGILATAEVQRFQTEVATLEQQIANEQGRWSEINRALEDLERALGRR
jgi:chromosome segregation ATPase